MTNDKTPNTSNPNKPTINVGMLTVSVVWFSSNEIRPINDARILAKNNRGIYSGVYSDGKFCDEEYHDFGAEYWAYLPEGPYVKPYVYSEKDSPFKDGPFKAQG